MRKIGFTHIVLASIVFLLSHSQIVSADKFSLNIGFNHTSGKYGRKTATDIFYVPITASYQSGRASFRVTVPFLNIIRPANARNQGGIIILPDRDNGDTDQSKRVSRKGLGDTTLALTYNLFYHRASRTRLSFTGRLKVPTGNTALGLGTGKVGYAVQTNLYRGFGRFNLNALFGYRIPGSPSTIKFSNTFFGAAGIGYRATSRSMLGVRFNINQSVIRLQDSRILMAYFLHRYDKNIAIHLYGLKGFSERSPEWGSGVSLRYMF